MDKYEQIIESILNKYIISTSFGCHIDSGVCAEMEDIDNYLYNCKRAEDEIVSGLWVNSGATKVVIGSDKLEFVLKVPFQGEWWDEHEIGDKGEDFYVEKFSDFSHGDYCYTETEVYERAEAYGVAAIFAKAEYVHDLKCGIPVYRQPRAIVSYEGSSSTTPSKAAIDKATNMRYSLPFKTHWIAEAIEVYGEEFVNKLINFLDNDPVAGCDLHDGNYGYTIDGLPIIIDYAGYFE